MFHFQDTANNWEAAIPRLPDHSLAKAVDRADILKTVKGINPSHFTILRHWDDSLQHYDGNTNWSVLLERARNWFRTHIDGTFYQKYVPYVDAVSWHNEIWANSQSQAERLERIEATRAAVWVWENEYKPTFDGKNIKLVIGEAAVGNDMPREIAQIAIESGNLLGYHPYSLWNNKVRDPGDFEWISGRYDQMEKNWGLKPVWVFTECGPFSSVLDGWRSSKVLGADVNLYVEAMRQWIRDMAQTSAYQEGRILGFTPFTTGGGDRWKLFETRQPEMSLLADMIREEWKPGTYTPPDPPPPPVDDNYLINSSFEAGFVQDGGLQVPAGWLWWSADRETTNPHDPNPWAEFVTPDSFVEESEMALDGVKVHRISKRDGSWYAILEQSIGEIPEGTYFLTVNVFGNLVKGYNNGVPIWADDPDGKDALVMLLTPGGEYGWMSVRPGDWNNMSAQFYHDGTPGEFAIEMMCPFPLPLNELILDDFSLTLVEKPPEPPTDETLSQHLWRVGEENQVIELNPGAAIQKVIFADGFVPVMGEYLTTYANQKYVVQVAEHLGTGERRTYYAIVPHWDNVMYITGPDDAEPQFDIINIADELPEHPSKDYTTRPLSAITTITIHHSAGNYTPQQIAAYHVSGRGWPGIGYHFLVMADGTVYQTNYLSVKSYHAGTSAPGDENYYSIGLCLNGLFMDGHVPPKAQQDAARELIAFLQRTLGKKSLIPHGSMPGAQTECPGDTQDQWLPYVTGG